MIFSFETLHCGKVCTHLETWKQTYRVSISVFFKIIMNIWNHYLSSWLKNVVKKNIFPEEEYHNHETAPFIRQTKAIWKGSKTTLSWKGTKTITMVVNHLQSFRDDPPSSLYYLYSRHNNVIVLTLHPSLLWPIHPLLRSPQQFFEHLLCSSTPSKNEHLWKHDSKGAWQGSSATNRKKTHHGKRVTKPDNESVNS